MDHFVQWAYSLNHLREKHCPPERERWSEGWGAQGLAKASQAGISVFLRSVDRSEPMFHLAKPGATE